MDAIDFVSRITGAGFKLAVRDDRLMVSPVENLTDQQRQFIRQHRPAIIAAITGKSPEANPNFAPLSDTELSQLIRQTATANNVTETAIREWLGDEIEALRSGDPAELAAFPTCVEQARLNGDSQDNPLLTINHAATDDHGGESGPVLCADCGHAEKLDHPVLVRCGVGRMAPGACGAWWSTTPHLCSEFAPITSTSEARR